MSFQTLYVCLLTESKNSYQALGFWSQRKLLIWNSLFHSSSLKLSFPSSPIWEPAQWIQTSTSVLLLKQPQTGISCPSHTGSQPTTPAAPPALPKDLQSQHKVMFDPQSAKNSQVVLLILYEILQPPVFAAPHCSHTTHKLWHMSAPSTHIINPQNVQG